MIGVANAFFSAGGQWACAQGRGRAPRGEGCGGARRRRRPAEDPLRQDPPGTMRATAKTMRCRRRSTILLCSVLSKRPCRNLGTARRAAIGLPELGRGRRRPPPPDSGPQPWLTPGGRSDAGTRKNRSDALADAPPIDALPQCSGSELCSPLPPIPHPSSGNRQLYDTTASPIRRPAVQISAIVNATAPAALTGPCAFTATA